MVVSHVCYQQNSYGSNILSRSLFSFQTIQYVDYASEPKDDNKVSSINNVSRSDDSHQPAQEEDTTKDEQDRKMGQEGNTNTTVARFHKVSFLKRKVDFRASPDEEEGESAPGVAKSKRRRRSADGSDAGGDTSLPSKRRRTGCECSEAIARLEYSMMVQHNRMKSSLDTLVASVGAIDARLLATSNSVSNFFTGFLKSFNRLVDTRVAETLRQHHHHPAGDDSNSD